ADPLLPSTQVIPVAGTVLAVTEGRTLTGAVAFFRTGNVAQVHAQIAWGDGDSSIGIIAAQPNDTYAVFGSNQYPSAGTFAIDVSIRSGNGRRTDVFSLGVVFNGAPAVGGGGGGTVLSSTTGFDYYSDDGASKTVFVGFLSQLRFTADVANNHPPP